jgi:hypothetical protein
MHDDPTLVLKADFQLSVARVKDAASSLLEAVGGPRRQKAKAAREFFAAWESMIGLYKAPRNWRHRSPQEAIPPDLIGMIGGLCGYLAVGKVPDPITDVKGGAGQKNPVQQSATT